MNGAGEREAAVEIAALVSLYGYLMDERDWPGLDRVFAADVVFDASAVDLGVFEGLDALRAGFAGMRHPVAHHVTNLVIERLGTDGTATAASKWLAPRRDGSLRTGEYHDELVRTEDGWRISRRTLALRRPRPDTL